MSAPRKRGITRLVSLPAVYLIRYYQVAVSPWFGKKCRFIPSCSQYTLEAIEKYGLLRGSYLGLRRIIRCNPWGGSGVDPVP